jgi:glycerol-3-phosphate acyltransferase
MAVLPKFFLEEMSMEGLEAFNELSIAKGEMIKGFLEEYLGVHAVVGREIPVVAGRCVGFLHEESSMERIGAILEEMDEMNSKGDGAVGLVAIGSRMHHVFSQYCKVSLFLLLLLKLTLLF